MIIVSMLSWKFPVDRSDIEYADPRRGYEAVSLILHDVTHEVYVGGRNKICK